MFIFALTARTDPENMLKQCCDLKSTRKFPTLKLFEFVHSKSYKALDLSFMKEYRKPSRSLLYLCLQLEYEMLGMHFSFTEDSSRKNRLHSSQRLKDRASHFLCLSQSKLVPRTSQFLLTYTFFFYRCQTTNSFPLQSAPCVFEKYVTISEYCRN